MALAFDRGGRVVSLLDKLTRTERIVWPGVAEAWRLVVPTGRHTVALVLASEQSPPRFSVEHAGQTLALCYDTLRIAGRRQPISARFIWQQGGGLKEFQAWVEIVNRSPFSIDEVEFPILGGFGGFSPRNRAELHLLMANDEGRFVMDCLRRGLPGTGNESNHFCRAEETAIVSAGTGPWTDGQNGRWIDVWSSDQGVYLGCHERLHRTANGNFFIKLEKYPKETPNAPTHSYPPRTPRWLRVSALHIPCVAPRASWRSPTVTLMPHRGDWHAGADRYAAWRRSVLPPLAAPPAWMKRFVGWTEILGKTYLGEVFHDYRHCADRVIRDCAATGIDLLFYYGHTRIGAEGADYDQSPDPLLGGERGFRAMIRRLHRRGIRIMLLDHLHRYVNRDIPAFRRLRLERYAVRDSRGNPVGGQIWFKETGRSCLFLVGPTPFWVDMCPACRPWHAHYLKQLARLIAWGIDGVEMDLYSAPGRCYATTHGHPPGADLTPIKRAFTLEARALVKRLNPDFVLFGETSAVDHREVLDGFYPNSRHFTEHGRIARYLFPEITQQAVLVGNYAYDQVNKALMLGIGVETEIWGLRRTAQDACPELARYIGAVTRFRRRHADVLINGRYRDTVGASVAGDVLFSVMESDVGRALILRNATNRPQAVRAAFDRPWPERTAPVLWRPFAGERRVRPPMRVTLRPWEAAVVLETTRRSACRRDRGGPVMPATPGRSG